MKGLSHTNLKYMRQFAACWPDGQIGPQPVGHLPWGHIRCLLDKLPHNGDIRLWYAQSSVEHGWTRKLLEHHIATGRYEREGKALTNFARALPAPESDQLPELEEISAGVQRIVERHADEVAEAEADVRSRPVEFPLLPATPRRGEAVAP